MKILAVDQGTTTTKAFVLTDDASFSSVGRIAHKQFHLADGKVEHKAEELAANIEALIDRALDQGHDIEALRWPIRVRR